MSSRKQKLLRRVNWYLRSSSKHITEWITGNISYYRGGRYRQVSLYHEQLASIIVTGGAHHEAACLETHVSKRTTLILCTEWEREWSLASLPHWKWTSSFIISKQMIWVTLFCVIFLTSIQIPPVHTREHNFLYYYLVVAIERTKIYVLELDTVPDTHTFP